LVGTKGPASPPNNGTCNLICNQQAPVALVVD
jgi:hypothetical protein